LKDVDDKLPAEEERLMNALFSGGRDVAEIDGEYHPLCRKSSKQPQMQPQTPTSFFYHKRK